ncbi:MAG: MFS transporter [Dehalococcoidia bacterium]|nr:MFS transporter [Dehalococcoidia bacterium]
MSDGTKEGFGFGLLRGPVLAVTVVNLVFFSGYLFFFPTLPFFIEGLGGRESGIGLLIGISSLTSLAMRPFVGYFVDQKGRKPILLTGMLLFAVNCILYNVVTAPAAVLPLRLLTGASLATVITGASTYIADFAPPERRGEILSYFALSNALGFAIGPALGGWIINADVLSDFDGFFTSRFDWIAGAHAGDYNFTTMFLVATGLGLVAAAIVTRMPESRPGPAPEPRRPNMGDFISRAALLPMMVNFGVAVSFAGMVTFLPLFAREHGLENSGNLFVMYALMVLVMRFTVGRVIDRFSRATIIIPSIVMLVATMVVVATAQNVATLFLAAGMWGAGAGVFQPAMMAFTVDRTPVELRGRAMSTFTMGMDLGISVGSFSLGIVVELLNFRVAYAVAACAVAAGLLLFTWAWMRTSSVAGQPAGDPSSAAR